MKQTVTYIKAQIELNSIIVGVFINFLSPTDMPSR